MRDQAHPVPRIPSNATYVRHDYPLPVRDDPTAYRLPPSRWRHATAELIVFVGLVVVVLALSVIGWEPPA